MKRKEHHPSASTSHSLWYSGFKFDFPGMDISPGTRALISALQAHEDGEEEKKKNPLLLNGLGDLASPTGPASTEPTREHNTFPPSLPATHKIALLQHYTPTHAFTNQQCVQLQKHAHPFLPYSKDHIEFETIPLSFSRRRMRRNHFYLDRQNTSSSSR
jgi:hypothetical protein